MNLEKFILSEFDQPQLRRKIDDLVFPSKDMISGNGAPGAEPKGIIQTMNEKDQKTHYDDLDTAWQKLSDHCREHGIVDVLLAVRDGYARELSLERAARGNMVRAAVAEERKRCAAMVRSMDPVGHTGHIENTADLCEALADAILKGDTMNENEKAALAALEELLGLTSMSDWPLIHQTVNDDINAGKYGVEFAKAYRALVDRTAAPCANDPVSTYPHVSIEEINGERRAVDRRVVERQPDGEVILRDPVTQDAWTPDGQKLSRGWQYGQDLE